MNYEIWVTHSAQPCVNCASYAGRTWTVGVGPQPVVDTHEFCRCTREPAESPVYPRWGERWERRVGCGCARG